VTGLACAFIWQHWEAGIRIALQSPFMRLQQAASAVGLWLGRTQAIAGLNSASSKTAAAPIR
jgi:hypothetical protein